MQTISIITPSYNQGSFIEETIKSIWSQKGNFKIEHLVMDGGSNDETVEILKKYEKKLKQKKYPVKCKRIKFYWVSKKDKGQSHAINKGLKISHGGILAYLNSDDVYEPGAFQKVVEVFSKEKVDLIYSNCHIINQESKKTGILRAQTFDPDSYLNSHNYIPQPTVFFTRKVYKTIGSFRNNYHYAMDYDYFIRVAKKFKLFYLKEKVLARFRIYQDSKSVSQQQKSWREARKITLKHGSKFFSQAFFAYYRKKLRSFFQKIGFDTEPLLINLSKVKQKLLT